jgi:hypothetical protein
VIERAPETHRLFALRSVKWKDADCRKRIGLQFTDVDLPPAAAQRGQRCGALVPVTDPRRKNLLGARGGVHPDPNAPDIVDLDDEEATRPSQIAPVAVDPLLREANFTVIDRDAARTGTISVARLL